MDDTDRPISTDPEVTLRDAIERFDLISRATNDAVWDWTFDPDVIWWNPGFETLFGWLRSEVEPGGASWTNRIHPDDLQRVVDGIHLIIDHAENGEFWQDEYRFRCKDGRYLVIYDRGIVVRDANGTAVRMLGGMQDVTRQRAAEQRLKESEDRFTQMAQDAPLKMWITDASGSCFFINRHWCEFVGQPMATQLGLGWANSLHPDDVQAAAENFMAASSARRPYRKEFRLRKHDGTFHWHLDTAQPRFADNGEFLGYIGSVLDTQEQHDANDRLERLIAERTAQLAESETRYRELADNNPAMMLRCNNTPGWPMLYVSKAAEQITGLPSAAFVEQPTLWSSLILEEDLPAMAKVLEVQLAKGPDIQVEYRIRHQDGSIRWIEGNARLKTLPDGSEVYEGLNIDVTARKLAEQELAERADQLERATIATSAARISPFTWYVDRDHVEIDALGKVLHGLGGDDQVGTMANLLSRVHADDRETLHASLRQLLETMHPTFTLEYRTVSEQGRVRWVRSVGTLTTEDGVLRAIGAVTDATVEVEVQRALEDRTRGMERANAELDEFTYIASHDLKEPLRGIHNYARFIAEDYADKLDAAGQQMLKAVSEQADRMQRLIEDLLEIARLGREPMKQAETNLDKLLDEVLASLSFSLTEKNVELRKQPLGRLRCDRVRVGEVFRNLITNALKYNDKPVPVIEIGARTAATGEPEFYVRDNGIGIRPDFHARVFAPFKRLHAKDAYGGGSGVGLAIVKRIVEAHGGHIGVSSEPGSGATFAFTLSGEHFS